MKKKDSLQRTVPVPYLLSSIPVFICGSPFPAKVHGGPPDFSASSPFIANPVVSSPIVTKAKKSSRF